MQVQYAQLGDTQLAYVEQGIGTPVLFVHGAGGDWRTFDPLRDVVAQSYRYISLSRRYHYPNTWNDAGQKYTIDQHAQDLAGFIAALTLPPVHLVGGSYGGRVAAWFALRHPKLLRSLTISEPGLVDADTPEARTAVARWHVDGTAMIAALRTGDLNAATRRFFDGVLDEPGAFERLPAEWQQCGLDNASTFGPMLMSPMLPPGPPRRWGDIAVPVLLLRGEKTRDYFVQSNDKLREYLPGNTATAVIPDAPHLWYPANPQVGAQLILDFVSRH